MYSHLREDSLKLIAFEVRLRRQQMELAAKKELKQLQMQMQFLNMKVPVKKYPVKSRQPWMWKSASN